MGTRGEQPKEILVQLWEGSASPSRDTYNDIFELFSDADPPSGGRS